VIGQAVLSAWKKENQFAVFITRIEAVITHPITYKNGFARFAHAPVLHFVTNIGRKYG